MRDPDAPLTETEIVTASLFLGDVNEWLSRAELGRAEADPRGSFWFNASPPRAVDAESALAVRRALLHGALHWLNCCQLYQEHRDLCPAIHVHFISPHEEKSSLHAGVSQSVFSLWRRRGNMQWFCEGPSQFNWARNELTFPCGLCWVTYGEEVSKADVPVNASLLWRVTKDLKPWSLNTDYTAMRERVFRGVDLDYYREWWKNPGMQAYGRGDPDLLLARFHAVTGLEPNMVTTQIQLALHEDFG